MLLAFIRSTDNREPIFAKYSIFFNENGMVCKAAALQPANFHAPKAILVLYWSVWLFKHISAYECIYLFLLLFWCLYPPKNLLDRFKNKRFIYFNFLILTNLYE